MKDEPKKACKIERVSGMSPRRLTKVKEYFVVCLFRGSCLLDLASIILLPTFDFLFFGGLGLGVGLACGARRTFSTKYLAENVLWLFLFFGQVSWICLILLRLPFLSIRDEPKEAYKNERVSRMSPRRLTKLKESQG